MIRTVVGGFYLTTAGVNAGLVIADGAVYRHFADAALFGFVERGWADIVMADPRWWIGMLAAGELAIGTVLIQGRWQDAGYAAAVGFHCALMLFGWGFWWWSLPAIAVLAAAWRLDRRRSRDLAVLA